MSHLFIYVRSKFDSLPGFHACAKRTLASKTVRARLIELTGRPANEREWFRSVVCRPGKEKATLA